RRGAVGAAEMIPLAAAAVIEDLVAAPARPDVDEFRRHLADRGVPVDRLEGAVGAAPERAVQPIARRLVEVEPLRLLAEVAARDGVIAVALDLQQVAAVPPADLDLDAAVEAAEDARGLLPVGRRHGRRLILAGFVTQPGRL